MMNLLLQVFDLSAYTSSPVDRLRAILLYHLSVVASAALVIVAFLLPEDGTLKVVRLIQTGNWLEDWWVLALILALMVTVLLVRQGYLKLAAWISISMSLFSMIGTNLQTGLITPLDFLGLSIIMLLATVLFGLRSAIAVNVVVIGIYYLFALMPNQRFSTSEMFYGAGALIVLAVVMIVVRRMLSLAREEGSSEADQERLKLAEINSFITRKAAERTPLEVMLNEVLGLLLESYPDFYHAQLFLLDDAGLRAQLIASTGSAGQKLLGEKHGLAVGSQSIIGQVTLQATPLVETAGSPKGFHRPNPALPLTRVEAAFPLQVDDRIIGALDLQSQREISLDENDMQAYQSVADSLSLAIDNYRQIELAQKRADDNRKLVAQTQNALHEVERLNQRLIGGAWTDYLQGSAVMQGFDLELATAQMTPASSWTTSLADAVTVNTIIQEGNTIALPLRVRGHVIGAIEFELPPERELSPEDMELVREIGDRFGLAAENTRLLEESLRAAQRESLINEISRRLQSASNVETTLTEAARSLRAALDARQVAIRLGKPETLNGASNGKKGS